jgi:hypothetical protein
MNESQFMKNVIELAQRCGWKVAHFKTVCVRRDNGSFYYVTPVQADGAGWPDLVLARDERLIFAELKADKGTVSPEQTAWFEALQDAGQVVRIWKPKDWDNIVTELER